MKIRTILTGSTGMIGKGVLLECLDNDKVEAVLAINRSPLGIQHPKLKEMIISDFSEPGSISHAFQNYNACFYCLGTSAFGITKEEYERVTYTMTLGFAEKLAAANTALTFVYISAEGADTAEKSKVFWAKIKGKTENALFKLPFNNSYMFRPGFIQPLRGIRSRTKLYNVLYTLLKPLTPLMKKMFPDHVTDTELVGKAMINIVSSGFEKKILGNKEINQAAQRK